MQHLLSCIKTLKVFPANQVLLGRCWQLYRFWGGPWLCDLHAYVFLGQHGNSLAVTCTACSASATLRVRVGSGWQCTQLLCNLGHAVVDAACHHAGAGTAAQLCAMLRFQMQHVLECACSPLLVHAMFTGGHRTTGGLWAPMSTMAQDACLLSQQFIGHVCCLVYSRACSCSVFACKHNNPFRSSSVQNSQQPHGLTESALPCTAHAPIGVCM